MKIYFSKSVLLLSLLFCSVWSLTDDYHTCKHDDLEFKPDIVHIEHENLPLKFQDLQGRSLASATYPNLRIYPYYGSLIEGTPEFITYIKTQLVPPVINYLQLALKMKYPTQGKLTLDKTSVCSVNTPDVLTEGVDADFFVFLKATTTVDTSWVASASSCVISSVVNRPIVASLLLNGYALKPVLPTGDPLSHEYNMYVIMHEMLHALGFSKNFFSYYVDNSGQKLTNHVKTINLNGSDRTVLDLPVLTDKLRKFYGCSDLEGAYMENNGGTGTARSHWERKFFPFDLLSSGAIHGRRVTEFTLAFMEGTGWYAADYDYAEPYFYGQGQGCSFIRTTCDPINPKFDEHCSGTGRGCSQIGQGGAFCKSDTCSDGCRFYTPQKEYNCENPSGIHYTTYASKQVYGRGAGSKCFTGNLTSKATASRTTYCFTYNCEGSGASTQLQVMFGTTTLVCKAEGPLSVDGLNGAIDCPDPLQFCSTIGKRYCPRNCLGRGKCVNNKCVCNAGFQGVDCGFAI